MLAIRSLQAKVNKIAISLGGLETNEKLEQAKQIARQDPEISGLLLEIVDAALTRRWNRDISTSTENFLKKSRK